MIIEGVEDPCEKMQFWRGNSINQEDAVIQVQEWHPFTVVKLG